MDHDIFTVGNDALHVRGTARRRSCRSLNSVEERCHTCREVRVMVSRGGCHKPLGSGAFSLARQAQEFQCYGFPSRVGHSEPS
jgi:hypothetical protein